MALQQIYWEQIATENVASGSVINIGTPSSSVSNIYADNFYVNGTQSLVDLVGGGVDAGVSDLNNFTASLLDSLELTGSNLTVKGDLNVLGTFTSLRYGTLLTIDGLQVR